MSLELKAEGRCAAQLHPSFTNNVVIVPGGNGCLLAKVMMRFSSVACWHCAAREHMQVVAKILL